jgi:hypothetical protein
MSEKKTIQFNPDFLKMANNKTQKKRASTGTSSDIKVREAKPKKRDDTLKKRSILRMIRQHQHDNYNKMFDEAEKKKERAVTNSLDKSAFQSDFEQSKHFMDKLAEETATKKKFHNQTLRAPQKNSMLYNLPLDNVLNSIKEVSNTLSVSQEQPPIFIKSTAIQVASAKPQYGCLKNGSLPTYKNWLHSTQRNNSSAIALPQNNAFSTSEIKSSMLSPPVQQLPSKELLKSSEIRQRMEKIQSLSRPPVAIKKKQKRTVRRTFKIGKSRTVPRVSVLVSNRTIRNNISTKAQLLKQTPISEVKKYLIKHGFIRVGSSAPNDVLRKMYESSIMICGELQNHNPDNLLYNFLNSQDK